MKNTVVDDTVVDDTVVDDAVVDDAVVDDAVVDDAVVDDAVVDDAVVDDAVMDEAADDVAMDDVAMDDVVAGGGANVRPAATGYLPIEQVLGGLKIEALSGGEVPMEAFTLIKVCRPDGSLGWAWRATKAPNREELLGALLVQTDLLRSELLSDWVE
ncbi:hypothetical protein ACNTMW_19200 [Planosporangium sp. 12N6]|uniref:hypothetical protein n=1 Tax=Planosporangium spinosum TaxID=3402278 RepID=UPI003CEBAC58